MIESGILLAVAFVIIGVVVLVAGFKKVKGVKKIHPGIAVGGCIVCLVIAGVAGGYLDIPSWGTADVTPPGTVCATFDISPSVGAGNGQLNSAEDTVTIGYYANTTTHAIAEDDNTTWVDTALSFVLTPQPFTGADADDLATCYYEVTNPDQLVDSASDTYYMVTKSGGYRQHVWTGDGTHYVSSSTTMLLTNNETLTLTIDTAQTDMSYVQNSYDPQRLIVKFSNGCGWEEYFYIDFICIVQHN